MVGHPEARAARRSWHLEGNPPTNPCQQRQVFQVKNSGSAPSPMMTSGARYSSVPTSELVRTLGCAASSMGLAALPLDRRLVELVRSMELPLRAGPAPAGGVLGADAGAGAGTAAGTSSGATLEALLLAKDRSKSVSWQWPEGLSRMFSGFRSLQE